MTAMPSRQRSVSAVNFQETFFSSKISVIVPLAVGETAWPSLLADLSEQLSADCELLVAGPQNPPDDCQDTTHSCRFRVEWLTTRRGRGPQMNDAARAANGAFLWFLHADSQLPKGSVAALVNALTRRPNDLHYFGLRFYDGPRWLRLNEIGVSLRCRLFGLPFGDQGFCIARDVFERLGGFDEQAPYGEDHLLVWKARRHGVRLHRVNGSLLTSGRKYAEHGWLRTTCQHVRLTIAQALPQLVGSRDDRGPL